MGKRVTILQAVELTGLSEYALRTGIKQGKYPYIRVGLGNGKILIDIDLLEQYLQQEAISNTQSNNLVTGVINFGKLRKVNA